MSEEKPEEVNPYADIPEHVMSGDVETIRLQARLIENEVKVCVLRVDHWKVYQRRSKADGSSRSFPCSAWLYSSPYHCPYPYSDDATGTPSFIS